LAHQVSQLSDRLMMGTGQWTFISKNHFIRNAVGIGLEKQVEQL
jgi:hypothetical protein